MILEKLILSGYRNYENIEVDFSKGVNLIHGKNGVGKTNIVESIYYLANLNSFRISEDRNLINNNKNSARILGVVDSKEYFVEIDKSKKDLMIDGIKILKHRDYIGRINVIGFNPEEIYLFKDFPKERRKFIDKEISKIDRDYLFDLLLFNRLLKERNEILKTSDKYKIELIKSIDKKIVPLEVKIISKRKKFFDNLNQEVKKIKAKFHYKYEIKIDYSTFVSFGENLLEMIEIATSENMSRDLESMTTNQGVHKDDWEVKIDNYKISYLASQGEQRLMIVMIKLAMANIAKDTVDEIPIIVLDDVFFELDEANKERLASILKDYDQVFITDSSSEFLKTIIDDIAIYKIDSNKITKEMR